MSRPPVLRCPHCGDHRQTESDDRYGFCNTCGRVWPLVPKPKTTPPVRRGSL